MGVALHPGNTLREPRIFTATDIHQAREEQHRLFYQERLIANALAAGLKPLVAYYETTPLRQLELIERPGHIAIPHRMMIEAVNCFVHGVHTLIYPPGITRYGRTVRYDL